jgi:photosystem II stability/assembly factor-like uncharacterized protein
MMVVAVLLTLLAHVAVVFAETPSAPAKPWTNPAYGQWHSATIGGGGYIQNVVPCPSDTKRFYAYGDMCGVYRSDDGGLTWRMIQGGLTPSLGNYENSGLTVDPRNADRIMLETGARNDPQGVYVSENGGGTWVKTLTAQFAGNESHKVNGFLFTRDPKNPDVVLAASIGTGVWRTEDNGKTWTDCGVRDHYCTDVRFDSTVAQRVYLCAIDSAKIKIKSVNALSGGFFRSDDGGRTWTKLVDDSPTEIVQDRANPTSLYGIFGSTTIKRSIDAGATWTPFAEGLPTTGDCKFNALAAGPNFVLTTSYDKGQYYRLGAGKSAWEPVPRTSWDLSGALYGASGRPMATSSITIDPKDPNHWFGTDFTGIYQTWDAGKTQKWTLQGIENTVVHCITPDSKEPSMVYVGLADSGGYWSTDAGASYTVVQIPYGGTNVKAIVQSSGDPNLLWEAGADGWGQWQANQLFVSNDRGRHFERLPMEDNGFPKGWRKIDSIIADPRDAKTVYVTNAHNIALNDGGVYKSVDGAKTWTWMGHGLPVGKPFFQSTPWSIWVHGPEIAISADGSMVAISNMMHQSFRFDPADSTWKQSPVNGAGTYYSVVADPLAAGRFYLASENGGVYRTDNAGVSWKRVYSESVQYVAADPRVAGRLAAGTKDGVALSTDSGSTWTVLDRSLPYRLYNKVGFAGNRLLAGSNGCGMFWYDLPAK